MNKNSIITEDIKKLNFVLYKFNLFIIFLQDIFIKHSSIKIIILCFFQLAF